MINKDLLVQAIEDLSDSDYITLNNSVYVEYVDPDAYIFEDLQEVEDAGLLPDNASDLANFVLNHNTFKNCIYNEPFTFGVYGLEVWNGDRLSDEVADAMLENLNYSEICDALGVDIDDLCDDDDDDETEE